MSNSITVEAFEKASDAVAKCDEELSTISDKFAIEARILQAKYEIQKEAIYARRKALLQAIPGFWAETLRNHPTIGMFITDREDEVLQFLDDITVQRYLEDPSKYTMTFTFKENPFIKESVIVREVKGDGDDFVATPATITWKEEKDKDIPEEESFFRWLTSTKEDTISDLIATEIYPDATHFFNGGGDDDEFDLESDEEGSVDLENEEEEELQQSKKRKTN